MKLKFSLALLVLLVITGITFFYRTPQLLSIAPTAVKDTLSSSQLSYFGRIGSGALGLGATTISGDNLIKVLLTTGTAPSNDTNNLFVGDTIGIGTTGTSVGTSGPLTIYTVKDIANTGAFEINTGIGQSNAFVGAAIIATRSAIHTISFTPKSTAAGGAWQFLINASGRAGETNNDGIPDQYGFDLGQDVGGTTTGPGTRVKTADYTCPFGTPQAIGTTTIMTGVDVGSTGPYFVFTCQLGAGVTNPQDVGVTVTIGRALTVGSQLVNPAPGVNNTEGRADSTANLYMFLIRHLDGSGALIDSDTAKGKVAVVESVRVTASVDPTLTFYIDAVGVTAVGSTACGVTMKNDATATTADAVSFGTLTLGAFNTLAQRLSAVTNMPGGYVITVYQSTTMVSIGTTGYSIPNTTCDGAGQTCGVGSTAAWINNTSASQWGYSMQNISANFTIANSTNGVGSTFWGSAFGVGPAAATTIMSRASTPVATEQAYVCYRLTASSTQAAGVYEDHLVYTATTTF
jgi:hypothetical protein